jgi:hypothetical protein
VAALVAARGLKPAETHSQTLALVAEPTLTPSSNFKSGGNAALNPVARIQAAHHQHYLAGSLERSSGYFPVL